MIMVWEEQQISGTPQSGAGNHWDQQGKCREILTNKARIVLPQGNRHLAVDTFPIVAASLRSERLLNLSLAIFYRDNCG